MSKVLRIFLWTIKLLLLAIALAAVVMWPISRAKLLELEAERYTKKAGRWEEYKYRIACWDRRLKIECDWSYFTGAVEMWSRQKRPWPLGGGWRWSHRGEKKVWSEQMWAARRGPLRWKIEARDNPYLLTESRSGAWTIAAPLWLVALVTGAWPMASIAFAVRRWRKRRRARRGLCISCGYDLRATPLAVWEGGSRMDVCPECGRRG